MLQRWLILCWVATLGADRVDLLGGRGPAVLLPFHVLTPLVVAALWWPRLRRGEHPRLPPSLRRLGGALLALLALATLSLLRSADVTISAGRLTLLAATLTGVTAVLWALHDHPDLDEFVQLGARGGLGLAVLFNAATVAALLGLLPNRIEVFPAAVNLEPALYGVIPRLAGPTLDMNRGAMLVLIFGTLVGLAPAGRRARWPWLVAAAVMLLGSLSRSAMLAAVPVLAHALYRAWASRRDARLNREADAGQHVAHEARTPRAHSPSQVRSHLAAAALLLAVGLAATTLLNPLQRDRSARVLAPLQERLDFREGSAQIHGRLMERGVEAGTRSLPQAMLGIGYGTSFRELADVFGGNPYGNYHSAWLSLWVEIGFLAMLLAVGTSLWPLRRGTRYAGLIVGLFVYNAVYIGFGDHAFWLATGLAWLEAGG